jgi:hypothetical protein
VGRGDTVVVVVVKMAGVAIWRVKLRDSRFHNGGLRFCKQIILLIAACGDIPLVPYNWVWHLAQYGWCQEY